jgi:UDP-N-acetylglucosamine 2-epimerase (hydrolysing)
MLAVDDAPGFDCTVFVTGMHMLKLYGSTVDEVRKCGFGNIYTYINQMAGDSMELILANTITGLSRYVAENEPDMIVVHGDRCEALAGAITGALRNTLVAHIEGGELSGTIDEIIRHAVSKMSHLHFVANDEAAKRLRQLGELDSTIFVVGSPDIDVMLSKDLPSIAAAKERYEISFDQYGLLLFHPVTTELAEIRSQARQVVDAVLESERNFIVIYPNNDPGADEILREYSRFEGHTNIRIFPSVRFEYFLSLMQNASLILGNSSAGIREAPFYGVPTVNVGSRQNNRFQHESIIECACRKDQILESMSLAEARGPHTNCTHFGRGDTLEQFMDILQTPTTWRVGLQKSFADRMIDATSPK